jgi:hypothetical protein
LRAASATLPSQTASPATATATMIQIAVADPLVSRLLVPFRPDQLPAEAVPKHGNRTLAAIPGRVPRFTVRNAAPASRLPPLGYVPFTLPPPCRRVDQKLQLPQRDGMGPHSNLAR